MVYSVPASCPDNVSTCKFLHNASWCTHAPWMDRAGDENVFQALIATNQRHTISYFIDRGDVPPMSTTTSLGTHRRRDSEL